MKLIIIIILVLAGMWLLHHIPLIYLATLIGMGIGFLLLLAYLSNCGK